VLADSIDAVMPGQRLREVRAIGNAYANSVPDSTRIISTERDWMRGDTIIAEFDSIAPGDTTSKPQARRIVANGKASSYYQLAGNGPGKTVPNINYVRGRVITVSFENRTVDKVDVIDQASGVYLEPSSGDTRTTTRTNGSTPPPATQTTTPATTRRRNP
jgi:hypothetical protein